MMLANLTAVKSSSIFGVVVGLTILLWSNPTVLCTDEVQPSRQFQVISTATTVATTTTSATAGTHHDSSSMPHLRRHRPRRMEDNMGRIINGNEVEDADRFPYYVALTDSSYRHICGGSLIAPDTVWTAAHCKGALAAAIVGVHDAKKVSGGIYSIKDQFPHPLWGTLPMAHDQMVLILDEATTHTPVRINLDPNVPSDTDEFNVIGFGVTEDGDMPDKLREIQVDVLPNDQCNKVFDNMIQDDMICLLDQDGNGRQCNGDSGGPWMMTGNSAEEDLQIGLVSWGTRGCLEGTPGVGARTSATNFIRTTTCDHSASPPDYFDCDLNQTYSPAPTNAPVAPTISPAPTSLTVRLELGLYFDLVPDTISWSIRSKEDKTIFKEAPQGTYTQMDHIFEEIFVIPGLEYEFLIEDDGGDGITGGGIVYDLYLQQGTVNMKIFEGDGDFKKDRKETFYVPTLDEVPTAAPTTTSAPSQYTEPISLTIAFDPWHQEISWSIVDDETESTVYAEKITGDYKFGTRITEQISLPPDNGYVFTIRDSCGDGLASPGYALWTQDETGERVIFAEGGGDFGKEQRHEFWFEPLEILFPETNLTKSLEDEE